MYKLQELQQQYKEMLACYDSCLANNNIDDAMELLRRIKKTKKDIELRNQINYDLKLRKRIKKNKSIH